MASSSSSSPPTAIPTADQVDAVLLERLTVDGVIPDTIRLANQHGFDHIRDITPVESCALLSFITSSLLQSTISDMLTCLLISSPASLEQRVLSLEVAEYVSKVVIPIEQVRVRVYNVSTHHLSQNLSRCH